MIDGAPIGPSRQLSVGELKFRAMVDSLMGMATPRMEIETPSTSKARNLRRMFYIWRDKLSPYEKNFILQFSYKLRGRVLIVERSLDFQPKEASNVSSDQGVPPGSNRLNDSR